MNVQASQNNSNKPFILNDGLGLTKDNLVLLQDAGRATALVFGTLLAKIAASGKFVPYTNEAATDGTALPAGVYIGPDIAAADIVAGDVADIQVLLGGAVVIDEDQLTIENAKTLGTVIAAVSVNARTVEDVLNYKGIYVGSSEDPSSFEN